mgnify:CR=1 FL=1
MKKFFALLFVCAGLTAMAAVPQVSSKAQVVSGKPAKSMVLKSNTLTNQLTAPVMKADMNIMSPQKFFTERGVTPNDNKLMKKAPRRVSADDVMTTKLAFMVNYAYDSDSGKVVAMRNYYTGGWDVEMEQAGDNQFNAYLYFSGIPFVINVDYSANTAEMEMDQLAGWQWSDTVQGTRYTYIYDTIEYVFLVDEAFMMDENAEDFTNLSGTLYEDGTIYFPEGWCLYFIDYTVKRQIRNGQTQSTTYDTVQSLTPFYRSTYLMTANATHDYDYEGSGTSAVHYDNLAYMYQYDDTTAIVWNLWQFGSRGVYFNIYEDGSMVFPSWQIVGTDDVDDLESAYSQYDWQTYGYDFYNMPNDGDGDNDQAGTVTSTTLEWEGTTWKRFCTYNGSTYALSYYPMLNNVVTFTDDSKFLFGQAAEPVINVTEGDDAYTFTGVTDEQGATVYLGLYDPETGQITAIVDNPYVVQRTDEDQVINLAAVTRGYEVGKNDSKWVADEDIVPATLPQPASDNTFIIHHAEVLHGDTVIIPVSLSNADDATAFQTDLYLPDGFELAGDITLSDRKADHVFNTRSMPDGAIRILCYSTTLQPLAGNEGELFYLTVSTPQESAGDYTLTLKKSLLTTTNYEELNCGISTGTLTVLPYLKGDANDSRSVNVADIVTTAMYILGEDPNPFVFGAADMNEDGEITVTDIVLIAHMILYPDGNHASLLRAPIVGNSHNAMSGVASYLADNQRRVSIILEGQTDLTAFQLDLTLPAGMTASNFCLTDRSGNHDLHVNTLDNGKTRVMCFSPQLEGIEGNQGTLLTFDVNIDGSATGDIMVDGVETVTTDCLTTNPDGFTIQMNGNGSTSVQEINNESRIYAEGNDIVIETPVEGTALVSDAMGRARRVNLQAGRNVIPAGASGIHIVRVGDKTAKLMLR